MQTFGEVPLDEMRTGLDIPIEYQVSDIDIDLGLWVHNDTIVYHGVPVRLSWYQAGTDEVGVYAGHILLTLWREIQYFGACYAAQLLHRIFNSH